MKNAAEQLRTWVDCWKQAGPALENLRRQELLGLDGSNYLALWDGPLQWACEHATERLSSGLVEQQRLFARLRSST